MTRLILTTDDSGAGSLRAAGSADIVVPFGIRFVWGLLPSDAELNDQMIDHWLWNVYRKHLGEIGDKEIGLIDFCERCETIELWIDPEPNAQLTLVWLLDYLRQHGKIALKLTLVQADVPIGNRQSPARRSGQMAAAGRQNPERSSGNSQRGVAGLSCPDAAGLVQPAIKGFEYPSTSSAGCCGTA